MPEGNPTRREAMRALGAVGAAGISVATGCIGRSEQAGSSTRDPVESAKTDPRGNKPSSESPTAEPAIDDREYAEYIPRKRFDDVRYMPSSVSGLVGRARANHQVFEDNYQTYLRTWGSGFPWLIPKTTRFQLSTPTTTVLIGDFERKETGEWLMTSDSVEQIGEHQGYDLYRDSYGDVLIGVTDNEMLTAKRGPKYERRQALEHQIDISLGETMSYYRFDPVYEAVVEQLPQGIYTTVFRGKVTEGPPLDTVAAGQTILLDGDHTPATGRTVLRFSDDVSDPRQTVEEYVGSAAKLWKQRFDDPVVSAVDDRMVTIEDRIDPAAAFHSR